MTGDSLWVRAATWVRSEPWRQRAALDVTVAVDGPFPNVTLSAGPHARHAIEAEGPAPEHVGSVAGPIPAELVGTGPDTHHLIAVGPEA